MSTDGAGAGVGGDAGAPPLPGMDDDLGHQIDVVVWILVAFSGIVLALRIWCKWLKHRGLWWDDNLLVICWVFLLICGVVGSYNRTLGFGKHVYAIDPANFPALDLNGNISSMFSILAAVWSKTSFALTMLRLMQDWKMKAFIWFIIVSMNIAMYLTIIFTWLKCVPPNTEQCIASGPYVTYSIASGAYSAAMDFILAFLPWPLIWGLQMQKKEKLGIAIAMSLGCLAGATAIMKCVSLPTMANGDFTYDGAALVIWGNAEVATTIMAASIPVLRVLFIHVKTSAERYYGSSDQRTGLGSSMRSKHHTVITANDRKNDERRAKSNMAMGDDRSDRSILDASNPRDGKIIQTNEVVLEYSHRRMQDEQDSDGWYEMGKVRQTGYAV